MLLLIVRQRIQVGPIVNAVTQILPRTDPSPQDNLAEQLDEHFSFSDSCLLVCRPNCKGGKSMYSISQDELMFMAKHLAAIPVYEAFAGKLSALWPETTRKVSRSQISFYNRHLYACVSFTPVQKKAQLPERWFVLTLGLNYPLESPRVAAKTEPYPGRWTTHLIIHSEDDLDNELFAWIRQAYDFAQSK